MRTRHVTYMRRLIMVIISSAAFLCGCDVHEFPVIPPELPIEMSIECNVKVPIHQEIIFKGGTAEEQLPEHDIRYIMNIYRSTDMRSFSRTADTTIIFTTEMDDTRSHELSLRLKSGLYNFMIWSDHVDKGSMNDKYYNTSDFSEIIYADRESYSGNNECHDAYYGSQQAVVGEQNIKVDAIGNVVAQEITITLERPFARYRLIATDLEEFIDMELKKAAAKAMLEAQPDDGSKADEVTKAINTDDYRVVIRHTGYMPCSFNMFTGKPADAWTGISFEGCLKQLNDREIELGFDYVFVNGVESLAQISAEIYDSEGRQLGRTRSMDIPLIRGHETIVKGNFLTSKASGGISIDTNFNGEDYNIEIK